MIPDRAQVLDDILRIMRVLATDLGTGEETRLSPATRLLGSEVWRSIDMIVLANEIQQHYQRTFAFVDYFTEVGNRRSPDTSVAELAGFVHSQLASGAAGPLDAV